MPFEDLLKGIVILTATAGFVAIGYVAFRSAMVWLRKYERRGEGLGPGAADEAAARFERLEHELAELHERVDFAERLLAQTREPGLLGRGGDL